MAKKSDREKQVKNISSYIKRILRNSAGGYDGTQGYQVELVATDIVTYRMIRAAFYASGEVLITETSREGDSRTKPNPLLHQLREQSKIVSSGLDLLTMNIKSKKGKVEARSKLDDLLSLND